MTISAHDRAENLKLALTLSVEKVGDSALNTISLDASSGIFGDVFGTTWEELHVRRLVTHIGGSTVYFLTGEGWLKGLEVTGAFGGDDFKTRAGKLSATLKGYLANRQTVTVTVGEVAQDSQLPYGFVYNSIDGKLLNKLFGIQGAEWNSVMPTKMVIRIPSTFGHTPLEI